MADNKKLDVSGCVVSLIIGGEMSSQQSVGELERLIVKGSTGWVGTLRHEESPERSRWSLEHRCWRDTFDLLARSGLVLDRCTHGYRACGVHTAAIDDISCL